MAVCIYVISCLVAVSVQKNATYIEFRVEGKTSYARKMRHFTFVVLGAPAAFGKCHIYGREEREGKGQAKKNTTYVTFLQTQASPYKQRTSPSASFQP